MASTTGLATLADCWVEHLGLRKRGIYRAESPAGDAVLVKVGYENRSTIAWVPAFTVEYIHEPQQRVLKEPNRESYDRIRRSIAAAQEAAAEADH